MQSIESRRQAAAFFHPKQAFPRGQRHQADESTGYDALGMGSAEQRRSAAGRQGWQRFVRNDRFLAAVSTAPRSGPIPGRGTHWRRDQLYLDGFLRPVRAGVGRLGLKFVRY